MRIENKPQHVEVTVESGRPTVRVHDPENVPHWKLRGDVARGWATAKFNKEWNGGMALDISEFSESPKGRVTQKRVMLHLDAEAVKALAEMIAKKCEGEDD